MICMKELKINSESDEVYLTVDVGNYSERKTVTVLTFKQGKLIVTDGAFTRDLSR